jgi:putative transcriptional regulator
MSASGTLLNRVRELRARLKLRQADLAAEVGVTRQTIIAIEKGRFNPSVLVSLKIARVLREPVDYVFYLAPGTEAELAETSKAAQPKRVVKRKKRTTAPTKPESAPEMVQEPVEVYDKAVKAAQTAPVEGPPVEIAAEARPAETPLSVVPPEPEMAEPVADGESEFEDDAEPSAEPPGAESEESVEETAPSEVHAAEEEAESPFEEPEEPAASGEPESAKPSEEKQGPRQSETDTGQAIWDFV